MIGCRFDFSNFGLESRMFWIFCWKRACFWQCPQKPFRNLEIHALCGIFEGQPGLRIHCFWRENSWRVLPRTYAGRLGSSRECYEGIFPLLCPCKSLLGRTLLLRHGAWKVLDPILRTEKSDNRARPAKHGTTGKLWIPFKCSRNASNYSISEVKCQPKWA